MSLVITQVQRAERDLAMARVFTRRQFLTYMLVMDGVNVWSAIDQVKEVEEARSDLDMDHEMTWGDWLLADGNETPSPQKG